MRNSGIAVFGAGYLGSKIAEALDCHLIEGYISNIDDIDSALSIIDSETKIKVIINCIGKTGVPNVDWCEDHKSETYLANVHIPYLFAKYCQAKGIKLVHLSSGCIYSGDGMYSEDDEPNFQGSYYSHTKYVAERLLQGFPMLDSLILRIRMPVDAEPSDRNLITKLLKYDRVILAKNSITVIPDLIDLIGKLIAQDAKGVINCVNPGWVYHNQIVNWYEIEAGVKLHKEYIEPEDLEVKAPRSNCVLKDKRLEEMGLQMPEAHARLKEIIKEYIKNEARTKS